MLSRCVFSTIDSMVRVVINGYRGKMGQTLIEEIKIRPHFQVVAGIDVEEKKTQESHVPFPLYHYQEAWICQEADVIIDFSRADGVESLLVSAQRNKLPLVLATTGLSPAQQELVVSTSKTLPILQASNFSVGIHLMKTLLKEAVVPLEKEFDIEIIERHHRMKVDAPSGTALSLAEIIKKTSRHPKRIETSSFGGKRSSETIGIHAVRGGTIVGEHTVLFAGHDEQIEISHRATSRRIFASGALLAAAFLQDKSPGLYGMEDLLASLRS